MKPREAYNSWAVQYDTNENRTRDLEARALRDLLATIECKTCLEIGCGTGKNTEWLLQKAEKITAVDLSPAMLDIAREKISQAHVNFVQADINGDWHFTEGTYDLVSFSLVLEHIEHLDHVFRETCKVLEPGGHVYIGELHPFKQYSGSKARFPTPQGEQVVECYNHHVSDFTNAARHYGLDIAMVDEYFDNDDKTSIPRILALLFRKNN